MNKFTQSSINNNSMPVCEPILYTESDKYKEMLNKELYKDLRIQVTSQNFRSSRM